MENVDLEEINKSETIEINGGEKEWLIMFGLLGVGIWVGYNKAKLEEENQEE